MSSGSFKNVITNYLFTKPICLIYLYKQYSAWNNLQGLMCHKTKPNPTRDVMHHFWPLHFVLALSNFPLSFNPFAGRLFFESLLSG